MAMADKLEEEQAEVVKAQKQIKDMAVSKKIGPIRIQDLLIMSFHYKQLALALRGTVFLKKWAIPGLFFLLFSSFLQTVNSKKFQ